MILFRGDDCGCVLGLSVLEPVGRLGSFGVTGRRKPIGKFLWTSLEGVQSIARSSKNVSHNGRLDHNLLNSTAGCKALLGGQ